MLKKNYQKASALPYLCVLIMVIQKLECIFIINNKWKNLERNAGAVIHVHSQEVVKLCLLNPENELKITGLEMIKVNKNYEMVFYQIK